MFGMNLVIPPTATLRGATFCTGFPGPLPDCSPDFRMSPLLSHELAEIFNDPLTGDDGVHGIARGVLRQTVAVRIVQWLYLSPSERRINAMVRV